MKILVEINGFHIICNLRILSLVNIFLCHCNIRASVAGYARVLAVIRMEQICLREHEAGADRRSLRFFFVEDLKPKEAVSESNSSCHTAIGRRFPYFNYFLAL
jgi:hypothetical protein